MQAIELPVISGFGLQRKARIERKAAEARLNYSAPAIELVDQPVEKSRWPAWRILRWSRLLI